MKFNNNRLKLAMANSCLSMGELASKSGINEVSIRRIINYSITPRPKTIGKIAKALDVRVEDLIDMGDI